MTMPSDKSSLADLFGAALAQFAKLFQNEVDLARAELAEKAREVGGGLKFMAVGAVIVIPALVLVLMAIAAELVALGLSQPLAYLCTGVVAGVVAAVLLWIGAGRLSGDTVTPSVTLDQIRRDKNAAEEIMR
jgi:hypothetical protein